MAPKLHNVSICFSGNFGPENSSVQLRRWTEANGGTFQTSVNRDTTHLVITAQNWKAHHPTIKTARNYDAKIVSYDWFEDRLRNKGRIAEVKYLWDRLDAATAKKRAQKQKNEERAKKRADKEAEKVKKNSQKINWGGALLEHTNAFAVKEDSDEEERERFKGEFRKGARAAKQDLMSENHHVYMDETAFRYDVLLVKCHLGNFRHAKVVLTIYESNTTPSTYATVAKNSGTTALDTKSIKTCMGSNFPTAFRSFREAFAELTGVNWDRRFSTFEKESQTSNGATAGAVAPPSTPKTPLHTSNLRTPTSIPGKSVNNSNSDTSTPNTPLRTPSRTRIRISTKKPVTKAPESPTAKALRLDAEFEKMKYRYRVPGPNEPRGVLPNGEHHLRKPLQNVYERFGRVADGKAKAKKELMKGRAAGFGRKEVIILDDEEDDDDDDDDEDEEDDEEEEEEDVIRDDSGGDEEENSEDQMQGVVSEMKAFKNTSDDPIALSSGDEDESDESDGEYASAAEDHDDDNTDNGASTNDITTTQSPVNNGTYTHEMHDPSGNNDGYNTPYYHGPNTPSRNTLPGTATAPTDVKETTAWNEYFLGGGTAQGDIEAEAQSLRIGGFQTEAVVAGGDVQDSQAGTKDGDDFMT